MLRQTVKSLLPTGSFKSSVTKGYEASFSKLFNPKSKVMARTSSLPLDDVPAAGVDAAAVDSKSSTAAVRTPSTLAKILLLFHDPSHWSAVLHYIYWW
jgi:hypothetical protein